MELFVIMIGEKESHSYWRPGAYVCLSDNDWGPSPTFKMASVPDVYLTARQAQDVIDQHNYYGVDMVVATFVRKT